MWWWSGSSTERSSSPRKDSGWSWIARQTKPPGQSLGSAWTRMGTFTSFSPVTAGISPAFMGVREYLRTLRHHGDTTHVGWW
ncbi:hypothetical protein CIB84_014976 [Bambusicola thoracicus]|uniref:Uncharacterized protein n=1 Tax=Bambusicola thoracicus TaxID=9083 RepID=A0A2P4SAY3_BAMTH|nr:hypothetical protein CIB84_014976 [Bambusicola thoracicus]